MFDLTGTDVGLAEMAEQQAFELPARELLLGLSVLGLPLLGVSGLDVNVNTSGPGWLIKG